MASIHLPIIGIEKMKESKPRCKSKLHFSHHISNIDFIVLKKDSRDETLRKAVSWVVEFGQEKAETCRKANITEETLRW